jgi:hypothetical protein
MSWCVHCSLVGLPPPRGRWLTSMDSAGETTARLGKAPGTHGLGAAAQSLWEATKAETFTPSWVETASEHCVLRERVHECHYQMSEHAHMNNKNIKIIKKKEWTLRLHWCFPLPQDPSLEAGSFQVDTSGQAHSWGPQLVIARLFGHRQHTGEDGGVNRKAAGDTSLSWGATPVAKGSWRSSQQPQERLALPHLHLNFSLKTMGD